MGKPFFSIIIPTLNEERYLPNLLSDLYKQTFKDYEVIIVDAKSEDKTLQRAERSRKKIKNFSILKSDKRNVSYQRNLGAHIATADWLIFMDADNRLPGYFLQGIKFHIEMLNPDILSTWINPDSQNKRDKAATILANLYIELQKTTKKPQVLESLLCINRTSFNKLGGFNENIHWAEGSYLIQKAKKKKMKFHIVREPKYTFSFRRLRKQGGLRTIRLAELEISRLRGKKLPEDKEKQLYPMEGGKYFEIDQESASRIEKLFLKLINSRPKDKLKTKLINRVYNLIKSKLL